MIKIEEKINTEIYTIMYGDGICTNKKNVGESNYYEKTVCVDRTYIDSEPINSAKPYRRDVLAHEIVHAFLDELGFDNYSNDEALVELLARKHNDLSYTINNANDKLNLAISKQGEKNGSIG